MDADTRYQLISLAASCGMKPAKVMKILVQFGQAFILEINRKSSYGDLLPPEVMGVKLEDALKRTIKQIKAD